VDDGEFVEGEVELSVTARKELGESGAVQALRSSVALAVKRVMAIRPDGSENAEQIEYFEDLFNSKNLRTQVGTPVATAFPTARKLTEISF
jgi:hypothetical protein